MHKITRLSGPGPDVLENVAPQLNFIIEKCGSAVIYAYAEEEEEDEYSQSVMKVTFCGSALLNMKTCSFVITLNYIPYHTGGALNLLCIKDAVIIFNSGYRNAYYSMEHIMETVIVNTSADSPKTYQDIMLAGPARVYSFTEDFIDVVLKVDNSPEFDAYLN